MQRHLMGCFLIAALLLGGCPRQAPVMAPLDPQSACPDWRWIGIKEPGSSCPTAAGWNVRRLFEPSEKDEDEVTPSKLPAGLDAFCLYEASSGNPNEESLAELQGLAGEGLVAIEQDCMSLHSAGNFKEDNWKKFQQHFFSQVGQASHPGRGDLHEGPPGVRLAFLDTQPTADVVPTAPGNSLHGYALAHMGRHLVCIDAEQSEKEATDQQADACHARITTQLAMPVVSFDRRGALQSCLNSANPSSASGTVCDVQGGGFIGSLSDLARAVRFEVEDWQKDPQERLVLNMSLGWDGRLFGGLGDDGELCTLEDMKNSRMSLGPLAVLCAVQEAACRGALVVAAAGNRRDCPLSDTGAILPAAWEARDAPGFEQCQAILEGSSSPEPASWLARAEQSGPLVYAAGGVQSNGSPLANSREYGEPPRVAYADHAVVTDLGGSPTAIYTGTSVAAAVLSSAAAVTWNKQPDLSPRQVMANLYDGGQPLGRTADFHHPLESGEVRRISLFQDFTQIRGFGNPPDLAWKGARPSLGTTPRPARLKASKMSKCLGPSWLCKTKGQKSACSLDGVCGPDTQPWNSPQPEITPCSSCSITPDGDGTSGFSVLSRSPSCLLHIVIDQEWRGGGVVTPTVLDIGGDRYSIPSMNLSVGSASPQPIEIEDCRNPLGSPVVLTFTKTNGRTVETPVFWTE